MSEPKMPAQWRAPQSRWKSLGPSALIAFLSLLFITAFFVSRQSTGGLDGIPFKTELIKE